MRLIFDSHVHLYPFYDQAGLFSSLIGNLTAIDPSAGKAAFLTDVQGGTAFESLSRNGISGMKVEKADDKCLVVRDGRGGEVHLFNGRQIVTSERLEILALVSSIDIDGRLPAAEVIKRIHGAGGVPAAAWAVGKWFGGRGDVIRSLIDDASLRPFLLGDSSMRPVFWGTPDLMEYGMAKGLKVVCGTDPLPHAGEERIAGTYATIAECALDNKDMSGSAVRMLLSNEIGFKPAGRRSSAAKWFSRILR